MMNDLTLLSVITWCCLPLLVTGDITLQLKGREISNSGGGNVLITDIGHSNADALLCLSTLPGCCAGSTNWYIDYGQVGQKRIHSDDDEMGWLRNRGRNPGVVRLRSRTPIPQPGQSQEGVYTCEIGGDGLVSVSLYYSLDVQISFQLDSLIMEPSYTITCTVTGGTVLRSSFTGPEDVVIQPLSPVGTPQGRGEDTYKSSVTRATGNHGDTFICMASNGASMATANYTISAALPPTNVTVNQVAPSVLNIQWTQPSGGAPVRSYTVTAIYGDGVVAVYLTLKTRSRSVMIQGLVNDGREYTICVAALSDHLPGITSFTAHLGQLTPPILVVTNVTATMATITHTHPPTLIHDYHLLTLSMGMVGGCNQGNTNNLTFFLDPNEASFTISNLEEATTYVVTAQSLSGMFGDSSVSQPLSFTTSETAPSEPPHNLHVIGVTSSSVHLRWDPLNDCLHVNGIPRGWQVRYWESDDVPINISSHINIPGDPLVAGEIDIAGLQPYTNCTFQVAAVTGQDHVGMFSIPISVLTLEEEEEEEEEETEKDGVLEKEGTKTGSETGSGEDSDLDITDNDIIQIQFGPTDNCITWTDEKAIKVELDIQFAIQEYIVMECPQCNEAIFQGQRGMFVCHDNPHWPTYRITLNDEATSFIIYLIQEWVLTEPSFPVGWLLVRVNPQCTMEIPSLYVAEQQVTMAATNQTVSLPSSSLQLIEMCMTELQAICNITSP